MRYTRDSLALCAGYLCARQGFCLYLVANAFLLKTFCNNTCCSAKLCTYIYTTIKINVMKKQTMSPARVAAKIDFYSGEKYLIIPTPEECLKIVFKAQSVDLPVYSETIRYPFDTNYPNLLWKPTDRLLTQTRDTINNDAIVVSADDFMDALSKYIPNVIVLNDDYDAVVNKDVIEVGCQEIPVDTVRQILTLHEKIYGKAK